MDLNTVYKGVDVFRKIDSNMQLSTFSVFLFVAQRGTCNQADVEAMLGRDATRASVSRNIDYWTDLKFDRRPGANFIQRSIDPKDRRHRLLTLTEKGKLFWSRLQAY
jgi:DNA-binding MarR family transcriptional regulator